MPASIAAEIGFPHCYADADRAKNVIEISRKLLILVPLFT